MMPCLASTDDQCFESSLEGSQFFPVLFCFFYHCATEDQANQVAANHRSVTFRSAEQRLSVKNILKITFFRPPIN